MLSLSASVDCSGLHQLESRVLSELRRGIADGTRMAAVGGREEAKRGRFKDHTGRLRSGLVARLLGSNTSDGGGFGVDWLFESMADYTRFVEYPTKAHWIRPREARGFIGPLHENQTRRNRFAFAGPQRQGEEWTKRKTAVDTAGRNKALKFFVGGKTVFAAKVWHPGTPGIPFMLPAREVAARILEEHINTVIAGLGKL